MANSYEFGLVRGQVMVFAVWVTAAVWDGSRAPNACEGRTGTSCVSPSPHVPKQVEGGQGQEHRQYDGLWVGGHGRLEDGQPREGKQHCKGKGKCEGPPCGTDDGNGGPGESNEDKAQARPVWLCSVQRWYVSVFGVRRGQERGQQGTGAFGVSCPFQPSLASFSHGSLASRLRPQVANHRKALAGVADVDCQCAASTSAVYVITPVLGI